MACQIELYIVYIIDLEIYIQIIFKEGNVENIFVLNNDIHFYFYYITNLIFILRNLFNIY